MKLGIIGYGTRIATMVREVELADPDCHVVGIVDVRADIPDALRDGQMPPFYDTVEEMIAQAKPDGIMIGTRCSLHTEMALKVFPSRIPLFLEKPVATTFEDLYRLKAGYEQYKPEVLVSFPLRSTPISRFVKEIVDSGKLGSIEHIQALNNVAYANVYFQDWYRDENETGGLFLQKATHDFDFINYILGMQPTSICAMTSKQIFKGSKPAGLKCVDCDENRTCLESTAFTEQSKIRPYCCFAVDTGNEDSGSALIRYENGMHVSYSQNFFVRNQAGFRGARIMGHLGTLELDFDGSKVKVIMHHTDRVETYDLGVRRHHYGGDTPLAENFVQLMKGKAISISPLEDGLLSALMCLKAKRSAETDQFERMTWD